MQDKDGDNDGERCKIKMEMMMVNQQVKSTCNTSIKDCSGT